MFTYADKYVPDIWHPTGIRREELDRREEFWRDYEPWFREHGYLLRPRYQAGWQPSWVKSGKPHWLAEDSLRNPYPRLLDATRISDNAHVVLKLSNLTENPDEIPILEFLLSGDRMKDPRNHCVPIYELLRPDLSDVIVIVMPLLYRVQCPEFDTIGEAVECFRQMFEGVQFIHDHNVAHRDCKFDSFMVESTPLFRDMPHPWRARKRRDFSGPPRAHKTRTQLPVKYFIIDYNLSVRYTEPGPHLEPGGWGGDKTVPEFWTEELCDPFAVDVYCLGNALRRYFTKSYNLDPGKKGFDFMDELLDDMCQDDPKARPTTTEVVSRFETIQLNFSELKLRSRVAAKDELSIPGFFRSIYHWVRQIRVFYTSQLEPQFDPNSDPNLTPTSPSWGRSWGSSWGRCVKHLQLLSQL
ncbi:hypothetical protein B0H11DRAFT_2074354 [Mycena galericulata]|nr:hypothetical protein B0H11DRAFT_2074354 [Mycena galericulata]